MPLVAIEKKIQPQACLIVACLIVRRLAECDLVTLLKAQTEIGENLLKYLSHSKRFSDEDARLAARIWYQTMTYCPLSH